MNDFADTYLDPFAHSRYPKKGVCHSSCFKNGWHRLGMIPVYSVVDGGLPGDILQEICLECEKPFQKKAFLPINQPRSL